MRKEPDEIEFEMLKRVVDHPEGLRLRAVYSPFIGKAGYGKETFLWKKVQLLIAEKYLERRSEKIGHVIIHATAKSRKLVKDNNDNNVGHARPRPEA
jgi:hypothetical protein